MEEDEEVDWDAINKSRWEEKNEKPQLPKIETLTSSETSLALMLPKLANVSLCADLYNIVTGLCMQVPSGRKYSQTWSLNQFIYLFGGEGDYEWDLSTASCVYSPSICNNKPFLLSDFWRFDVPSQQWEFISVRIDVGGYVTHMSLKDCLCSESMNTYDIANVPDVIVNSRSGGATLVLQDGDVDRLLMFGGRIQDSGGEIRYQNDILFFQMIGDEYDSELYKDDIDLRTRWGQIFSNNENPFSFGHNFKLFYPEDNKRVGGSERDTPEFFIFGGCYDEVCMNETFEISIPEWYPSVEYQYKLVECGGGPMYRYYYRYSWTLHNEFYLFGGIDFGEGSLIDNNIYTFYFEDGSQSWNWRIGNGIGGDMFPKDAVQFQYEEHLFLYGGVNVLDEDIFKKKAYQYNTIIEEWVYFTVDEIQFHSIDGEGGIIEKSDHPFLVKDGNSFTGKLPMINLDDDTETIIVGGWFSNKPPGRSFVMC